MVYKIITCIIIFLKLPKLWAEHCTYATTLAVNTELHAAMFLVPAHGSSTMIVGVDIRKCDYY